MATSRATSVDDYLAELPDDRRAVVQAVRALVRQHIPQGYREGIASGMISWVIPLERYPKTYNRQPLQYVGLAAQKRHYALYLMSAYADLAQEQALRAAYAAAGKPLDMGKSCLRFASVDALVPEAVGATIASLAPDDFIALYERSRER